MHQHPYVSEDCEGKPWFEWCVAAIVVVSALLAVCGYTMAATVLISVAAIISGLVRVIMREHSPWKVRSVAFDFLIGVCLGVGLLVTYLSVHLII